MILGALFVAGTLFLTFVASSLLFPLRMMFLQSGGQNQMPFSLNSSGNITSPQNYSPPPDPYGALYFWLFALAMGYSVLVFVTGMGIYRANPRFQSTAIVLFGLLTLAGGGWSVLSLALVTYCILRKIGVISGPIASRGGGGDNQPSKEL